MAMASPGTPSPSSSGLPLGLTKRQNPPTCSIASAAGSKGLTMQRRSSLGWPSLSVSPPNRLRSKSSSGRSAASWSDSHSSDPSSSCSMTCSGPSRACSISSTTSPTGSTACPCSCSRWRDPSCSTSARAGAVGSPTRRRSCWNRYPRPIPSSWSRRCSKAPRSPHWQCRRSPRPTPRAGRRIAAAAEGNPLYVEQVIEMLVDDGLVTREADGRLVIGDLETISVPPTIAALLAARLDRLEDGERRTIERASVVGKEFAHRDVSELTPAEGRPAVPGQLMGLVRKELIRPDGRAETSGETYRFRHLLVRDAAYDSLPKIERAELHERFADWLERTAGDRLADLDEIVGYHLDQARTYRLDLGPDDDRTQALALRAGQRLEAAGRRAAEREEVQSSIRLLSQAETLLVADPATRYDVLILLIDVAFDFDRTANMAWAKEAVKVGAELGEVPRRRADLWLSAIRGFVDPSFLLSDIGAEVGAAIRDFEAAGEIDALL